MTRFLVVLILLLQLPLTAQVSPDSAVLKLIEDYRDVTMDVPVRDSIERLIVQNIRSDDLTAKIRFLEARAFADIDWDQYDLALARLDSAYQMYPPEALAEEPAFNRAERARVLSYLGRCPESLELFAESLARMSGKTPTFVRAQTYYLIALMYCEEYELAIEASERLIPVALQLDLVNQAVIGATVMANSHNNLNRPEAAIEAVARGIAAIPEPREKHRFYQNLQTEIGNAYLMQEDFEAAYQTFLHILEIDGLRYGTYRDTRGILNLARLALETKRYDESVILFGIGLPLAEATTDVAVLAPATEYAGNAYYAAGLVDSAYLLLHRAHELRDTIYDLEMRKATRELSTKYETERVRQELELAELRVAQQRNRNRILALGGGALILVAGLLFVLFYGRQCRQQLRADKRRVELEYSLLRAQMNPHFIFNSLNSIQGNFSNNRFDRGNEFLGKFSKLIRRVLDLSAHQRIPLTDELETLQLYLQLESLRLSNRLHYSIEVDPEVETDLVTVPPLLLQPFVENAIWHGIAPKKEPGTIEIRIGYGATDRMLLATITDDGVGFAKQKQSKHESKGIRITRERLGPAGAVEIREQPTGGVGVSLKIPVS